ncbi:MAG: hypothetical protein OQK78_10155 [Gammaproteobacteria bacterium]|nr:hypothetical protein [Gammaproteobacteria bacterium]MCW8887581.1 hypothetical protein [Gammaproteobacteria bacterium]
MSALLRAFWMVSILKMAPQAIPASQTLLALVVVTHFAIGAMLSATALPADGAVVSALLGTVVMMAFVYLILMMRGQLQRFVQTVTALAGCEAMIGLIALPLTYLFHAGGGESGLIALFSLLIFAWNIMIAAHVFKHAFDLNSQQGVFYAVLYIFTSLIVGTMLGVST